MTNLKACLKGIAFVYNWFIRMQVFISCVLIIFMMLSIGASVLFRKTFLDFGWALEVSELIMIVITLFGSGWLLRTAGHIRVDIVAIYFHGRSKYIYNAIIYVVVSLVCLAFTVIGIRAVAEAYSTGTIEYKVYFQFQKWILQSIFPIAGFVMFVESTKLAVKNSLGIFSKTDDLGE